MNRIILFLVIVYFASALGAWALVEKNTRTNNTLSQELAVVKSELASTKSAFEVEKTSREMLEKKVSEARINANFLSLSLCPTLEATDKNALCVKNSTEWLSQTIVSGVLIKDPGTKTKMDTLLTALSAKTKPTAKQLYEMLKPIEVDSLKELTAILK